MPSREEFQIGWICALPIETAAAKEMLDENFGILEEQDSTDTNSYTLGRIGKQKVVIAGLPGGNYGISSATAVAVNMMRTFSKTLRIGLMVGVGGGIPSSTHDIRLGDIVVSYPEGTCGGVLQYDMGKIGVGGKLQRTGALNSPPRSLMTAVANMRAAELTDDPTYPEYIEKAIRRTVRTRRTFHRPDAHTDRLFRIEHEHPMTAATCDECSGEWEEMRHTREQIDSLVHYGIVASGNTVIKHASTRERLRSETGALCFEMEAAGLMMDFPCIVIRGICDYADSHKNKRWQGYAALVAASYAKELLSYVPVAQVSKEKLVTDVCSGIVDGIKDINDGLERAFIQQEMHHSERMAKTLTKEQQECHQVFKTSTYEQYKNINPTRVEGTCTWVLDSSQYLRWWESNHNDLLWISADPGCGKSVLAKSLIDIDMNRLGVSVCHFFFKDNEEQNNLATALCAILHQLFAMQPNLLQLALPSWEKNGNKLQREVDELWRILMAVASSDLTSSDIVCVFDALDECQANDRDQFIHKLSHFYTHSQSSKSKGRMKFLITSRPYSEIQQKFRLISKDFPQIHLQGEAENERISQEVRLVVTMRLAELTETLKLPPDTQQKLQQQLLQMEHRTYLWLYLAIDDIRTTFGSSFRPDEQSIRLIPSSIDAAYGKLLDKVPADRIPDMKMILQIIVSARRPLTVQEMAMALGIAMSPGSQTTAKAGLNPEGLDEKIRQLCGLFVFIKESRIYLVHQTAREFLVDRKDTGRAGRSWSFDSSDAENLMAQICVRYLLMDDLCDSQGTCDSKTRSFLAYSAEHWPDHVRRMSSTAQLELEQRLDQLYDVNSARYALWFPWFWETKMTYAKPRMDPIHLAAFNGHASVTRKLIVQHPRVVHQTDSTGTTALQWASRNGHLETVRILLKHGTNLDAYGGIYGSALQAASKGQRVEVVNILLTNGADVNAGGGPYGNPLQAACVGGYLEIVQTLLEKRVNVHAEGGAYGTALQAACRGGHIKVVKTLLDSGADINAQCGRYSSALQTASIGGHLETVEVLLENGANINARGGRYSNALQAASLGGHLEIVKVLLENGADINAQGGRYGTALRAASQRGHDEIRRLLLENGAVEDPPLRR